MAASVRISESEILDELRQSLGVQQRQPGFYSMVEMAEQLGCSTAAVRLRIIKWKAEDRIESMRVKAVRGDGQACHITVYRLKPQAPKARR